MKPRAIIFDMDGVIIDSESIWTDIETDFYAEHGAVYSQEHMTKLMGGNAQFCAEIIKEDLGLDWSIEKIIDARLSKLMGRFEEKLELIPGYSELMADILQTNFKRGLGSGSPQDIIDYVIDKFDMEHHFEVSLSCDEVGKPKPEPDIFLEIADRLRVKPENCVVIEDSANGVVSAKAAGMICIATPNPMLGDNPTFNKADIIREKLSDVTLQDLGL